MKKRKESNSLHQNISRRNMLKSGAAMVGAGLLGPIYRTAKASVQAGLPHTEIVGPDILTGKKSDLIRAENAKPGTTDWLLTKIYQDSDESYSDGWFIRKEIQGYASHLSIKAGETLKLYLSAEPADEFQLDIYRMGYYGGKGGRLVKSIGSMKAGPQAMPEDGLNKIIDCQWEETLGIEIPRDWLSGVYLGKLSTLNTEGEAYIIFIVRDDRQADLEFQCSDFTWHAYNRWPKFRSIYDTDEAPWGGRGARYDGGFNRPFGIFWNLLPANFEPITNGSGEFLLWEHPLVYWLEKEGYDVTYISNLDTHQDGPGLLRCKAFLSVGHDEYWTQEMYDNVIKARDAGVSLAFLCGNSVAGRIELLKDSKGLPNRGMRRSGGFGVDSAEIMGSRTYGVGFGDWICARSDHWVFEGTGMRNGDSIPHLVGWEYHGYPLAEKQPSLVVLAEGPIHRRGDVVEDRRHAATMYTASKGNIVFNAGTCWWTMVLSAPPGFVNPPHQNFKIRNFHKKHQVPSDVVSRPTRYNFSKGDDRVRRITKNVLDRMISIRTE